MTQVYPRGRTARLFVPPLTLAFVAGAISVVAACASKRQPRQVDPVVLRDVPEILRGTIGSEATINGTEPQLVSGLGVVIGLNGTGGGDLQPAVAATMERELARNGIGRGSNAEGAFTARSPQEFLRDPNVAVVIVEARVPPGAPDGSTFDVSVRTIPGSSATSLEGGTLWSTDLRIGPATTLGGYKTRQIATAKGPVYINPFAEPGSGGATAGAVSRTTGRVLGGGRITEPLKLELLMDSDSHSRARSIVSAINGRFPRAAGAPGQTARGRGGAGGSIEPDGDKIGSRQSIAVSVPREYRDEGATFLQLLRYSRVDPSYPEEFARRYVEELKNNPALSEQIGWCLKAVGKPAIPFLVPVYDYPELAPRLTALEAGAFLGDARAAPHLIKLAQTATPAVQTEALKLLGKMPANPEINLALRELVSSPNLDVRIAAWEGLSRRNDPSVDRAAVGPDPRQPKFTIETVAAGEPMVYITQQEQPKIVIFGNTGGRSGQAPTLVTAWANNFMLVADGPTTDLRLSYSTPRSPKTASTKPPENLTDFVRFMARRPSADDPGPGLDLTYSDVVGALYEMSRQGGITAVFATEQDRLRAEIYEASQTTTLADRPETNEPDDPTTATADTVVFNSRSPAPLIGIGATAAPTDWKPRIIPLAMPTKPSKASTPE